MKNVVDFNESVAEQIRSKSLELSEKLTTINTKLKGVTDNGNYLGGSDAISDITKLIGYTDDLVTFADNSLILYTNLVNEITSGVSDLGNETTNLLLDTLISKYAIVAQTDELWASYNLMYGKNTVSASACGPSSITNELIIAFDIRDKDTIINLYQEILDLATKNGGGNGSFNAPNCINNYLVGNTKRNPKYETLNSLIDSFDGTIIYNTDQGNYRPLIDSINQADLTGNKVMILGKFNLETKISYGGKEQNYGGFFNIVDAIYSKNPNTTLTVGFLATGSSNSSCPFKTTDSGHYVSMTLNVGEFKEHGTVYLLDSFPRTIYGEKEKPIYRGYYAFSDPKQSRTYSKFNENFEVSRVSDTVLKISLKNNQEITPKLFSLLSLSGCGAFCATNDVNGNTETTDYNSLFLAQLASKMPEYDDEDSMDSGNDLNAMESSEDEINKGAKLKDLDESLEESSIELNNTEAEEEAEPKRDDTESSSQTEDEGSVKEETTGDKPSVVDETKTPDEETSETTTQDEPTPVHKRDYMSKFNFEIDASGELREEDERRLREFGTLREADKARLDATMQGLGYEKPPVEPPLDGNVVFTPTKNESSNTPANTINTIKEINDENNGKMETPLNANNLNEITSQGDTITNILKPTPDTSSSSETLEAAPPETPSNVGIPSTDNDKTVINNITKPSPSEANNGMNNNSEDIHHDTSTNPSDSSKTTTDNINIIKEIKNKNNDEMSISIDENNLNKIGSQYEDIKNDLKQKVDAVTPNQTPPKTPTAPSTPSSPSNVDIPPTDSDNIIIDDTLKTPTDENSNVVNNNNSENIYPDIPTNAKDTIPKNNTIQQNDITNVSDDGKNIENNIDIPSDITGSSSINNANNIDTKQSSSNKGFIFGAIGAAIAGVFAGISKKFKDRKNKKMMNR